MVFFCLFLPFSTFALGGTAQSKYESFKEKSIGKSANENVYVLVGQYVGIFLSVLSIAMIVVVLYAGLLWMTAAGNAEQVTKAKKIIITGIVGFFLTTMSYGIAYYVTDMLERGRTQATINLKSSN